MATKKTTKTSGTKKPVATKTATRKTAARVGLKKAPSKPTTKTRKKVERAPAQTAQAPAKAEQSAPAKTVVSAERYFHLIQEQAYFLAEKDGFRAPPDAYWFAAERAVGAKHEAKA